MLENMKSDKELLKIVNHDRLLEYDLELGWMTI